MSGFTPVPSLVGGALIGASSVAVLLLYGRIAGISSILGGALTGEQGGDGAALPFRAWFLGGLLAGGLLLLAVAPSAFERLGSDPGTLLRFGVAGLLVGFGSRLGGGCTSGHGVCGLSLRSRRSLAATLTFMAVAVGVVFVRLHLGAGGAP